MSPGLWERCCWAWGLLLWLRVGSAGDAPPTQLPECTDFQNANLLRGTNLKVRFLLFTPSHPSCGQLVEESSDIQNSGFNVTLGTKLIIHGFRALGTKPSWINKFIEALLRAADANVIAVDWVYGSTAAYYSAVENVVKLGLEISRFLSKLLVLGVSKSSVHIIGVSLGAHVGGMVGHFYKGQLGRITGLDPAGPEYTRASLEERLDAGDALFVEAIHTDTDNLGIRIPVGHVDYFVNGGQDQPGCPSFIHAGYSYLICDHMRAVHLYISALENSCPLMAFPCASYKAFLAGHCLDCFNPFLLSCPRIGLVEQDGVKIEPLPKEVKVYLLTSSKAPYCGEMGENTWLSSASVPSSRIQGSNLGCIHLSMAAKCITASWSFTCRSRETRTPASRSPFLAAMSPLRSRSPCTPRQQHQGKGVIVHPNPQCQINQVKFKFQASNRVWKKDQTIIVGRFCTAPLPVHDNKRMVCLPEPVSLQASVTASHDLKMTCG
ncbi:phospholipase A1 member A isoform X1 [Equus przewalskii]|uniref:Phospholipase A1 member A n=1 Tax=Equus przewalskii TaxID=9798 RepID=A0ABM4LHM0_EQUPR|nr:phospholipase A1 member A isoform X1 [Equus caballus]